MRCLAAFVCCLSLAAGDLSHLDELYQEDRVFALREALEQPGWDASSTLFYRAVVEARFGHETEGIEDLRKFLPAHPNSGLERKANEELASALERIGRYGEAARALTEALRLTPPKDQDRAGNENNRSLDEALSDVAPQTVQFEPAGPIEPRPDRLGSRNVPVEVNGREAEWTFDTGANLSTIVESEAARLGLSTRESNTYVTGSTGKKTSLRLAVAREFRLGGAHLGNVVFLVLPDAALYVVSEKYQIRGILGLPVIRALGTVGISSSGAVRIGAQEGSEGGAPNLFFDDLDVVAAVYHSGHQLQMFLDTGANATEIYPSFRSAFVRDELGKLRSRHEKTAGAGGMISRKTDVVSTLRLEILGRTVDIPNVSLLRKQPAGKASDRDGVLGMDALAGGFTLDFVNMRLRLQ